MKNIIAILTIITIITVSLSFAGNAQALVVTPTSAPSTNPTQVLNQQISQLKDKIASQVSQLNLVEKRGVIGTIQDVTNSQITLSLLNGETQYVDVDEITKFSSGNSIASFGISDLKKSMLISVLGIYNKDSQRILARYIGTEVVPTRFSGVVASIDKVNYDIYIMTEEGKQVKVEIDTTSTLSSYSSGASLSKYGFSKLVVGDRVQGDAYPDKKDATLLIDDRLIDYLNAPKDPNISMNTPTPTQPPAAPTSKGAKGITPIK